MNCPDWPNWPKRPHAPLLLMASILLLAIAAPAAATDDPVPLEPIGRDQCQLCHRQETAHWDPTVHGRIFSLQPQNEKQALLCESCHGPGSRHRKDPLNPELIIGFTHSSATSIERMNQTCLDCHRGGERIHWPDSIHESQGLACSDCHNPMAELSHESLTTRTRISQTCLTCHPQQRVEFRKRSHMPLFEGKIECADCHNPHGSVTEPLLRGDSVNQLCYECHADKRGPFIWEHAPVVDSCLNCHKPHGSNHEALLESPSPFLCQSCHDQAGGFSHPNDLLTRGNLPDGAFPDERAIGKGCVNCHSQIHGSNHPSGARFHR